MSDFTVKVARDDLPKIRGALERLAKQHVVVGVLGDAKNAAVAYWAEYGTEDGRIPPRGLLSRPLNMRHDEYVAALGRVADHVARGESGDSLLGRIGLKAVADVKNWVAGGNATPENAASTIESKGSATPLIDTAQLLNAIQSRVVTT